MESVRKRKEESGASRNVDDLRSEAMHRYSLRHGTLAEKREDIAFEDVKAYIFPKLMEKEKLALRTAGQDRNGGQRRILLQDQDQVRSCIPRSFYGEFEIAYVIDWSRQFPQMPLVDEVTERHLRLWNITQAELHKTAMANLSKNKIHIRYVVKNHVPWDDVLVDSVPEVTIYQLSYGSGIMDSYALDILLFEKQFREIERMLERPFYLILCEPYPLMIPYVAFAQAVDFDRIYSAICRSSFAPEGLVRRDVYVFDHGELRKTGIRIHA